MAAETVQSTLLSNRDAHPQIPNTLYQQGRNFQKRAAVSSTTGKTSPSYYGFFDIPSTAYVTSVEVSTDALSTSTTMDIGCYETTQYAPGGSAFATTIAGGVANSVTNPSALTNTSKCWGSAVSFATAFTKQQQLLGNASFVTRATMCNSLWAQLGFTVDPQRPFDVLLTSEATITAGGGMCIEISYKMQ